MEIGVTQPYQLLAAPFEDRARDHFAFHDVIGELIDRNIAGALVRIGVVAHLEAGVEPLLDDRGPGIALPGNVQLTLVDEHDDRNLLDLEGSDQSIGDPLEIAEVRHLVHDGAVVDGNGHAPCSGGLRAESGECQRKRRDDRQDVSEHESCSSCASIPES